MRKGTLTVKLKFKVLPDGLSGQSVAGEPVFPASIAQGNTFEVDISPICDTRKAEVKYSLVSNSLESVTDTAKIYIPASLDAYNIAFKRKLVQSIIYCATERERVWATIDYEATRLFTGIVDLSNLTIQSYSYQGDIELTLKDNGYLLDEKIAQSIELPVQAFPRFNSASSPKTKGVYYKDPDNANAFYFWNGSAWAHKESFSDTESKYFHPDATVRVWSSAVVGGELAESVVGTLLGMAGYSVSGGTIDPSASDTSTSVVRCFTYDMSEDKTYKEVLDTLLKEYRMCLTFTSEGKVRIVSLSHTSIHATRDIGYGLKGTLGRRDGIKTTFEASKKDGVKLKYSSGLAVRREQSIYSENLGSEFDENGELKGTAIKPQQCLPETGDITATYQEYNAKFLDRAYTTKVNRKENEDLSIISTHGHHLEVAQKGGTLTYPAFTVGESAEHGTGANPYFMPKKAQVLFRNDYEMKNKDPDSTEYEKEAESHSIYLQIFNIVADVLYRDKTTTIYAPSATANPETYESTYLFEDGPARTFANFYLDWNQYGAMKTDWTEYKGTVDTIGSIIGYQHTDSAISSYCLLSEETISFTGSPDVPFVIKMHGIGIAPYNDKPVQSVSYMGDNKNRGANGATGPKGETGATGISIIGIVEEYALSSSSSSVTGSWGTAVPTLSPTDKYLWNRSKTMYSDGTSSAYTTAVVIGVYGDTGKAMTYMYASAPEGLYPGGYPFGTDQNVIGMADTAIGIDYEWHDTVPDIADGYVLWTKTTAPDGTVSIYRVQGPQGNPGATGATGRGISSIAHYYATTTTQSAPSASSITSTTIPAMSASKKYLWRKTVITYTDSTTSPSIELIAIYGDTGDSASIKDFDVDLSAKAFSVSPRGYTRTAQTIVATCTLIHVAVSEVTITWSSTSSQVTLTPSSDKTTCTISVAARVALLPFRVSCAVTGVGLTKTVSVDVQPESGNAYSPIYLGTNWDTSKSWSNSNDPIFSGDYYLDTSTNTPMIASVSGSGTITYSAMQTGNPNTALIMGTVLSDILAQGSGVQSTCVAVNAYFGAIAAKTGFIKSLRSQVIQSTNYTYEGMDEGKPETDASWPVSGWELDGPNNVIKSVGLRSAGGEFHDVNITSGNITITDSDMNTILATVKDDTPSKLSGSVTADYYLVDEVVASSGMAENAETSIACRYDGASYPIAVRATKEINYSFYYSNAYIDTTKEYESVTVVLNDTKKDVVIYAGHIKNSKRRIELVQLFLTSPSGTITTLYHDIDGASESKTFSVGTLPMGTSIEAIFGCYVVGQGGYRQGPLLEGMFTVTASGNTYSAGNLYLLDSSFNIAVTLPLSSYLSHTSHPLVVGSASSSAKYSMVSDFIATLSVGNFQIDQSKTMTYSDGIYGSITQLATVTVTNNSITMTRSGASPISYYSGGVIVGSPSLSVYAVTRLKGATVYNLNRADENSLVGTAPKPFANVWTQNLNNVPVTDSNNPSLAVSGASSIVGALNQINRDLTKKASFTFKHQIIRNWSGGTGGSEVTYDCVANNYLPNDTSRQYVVIGEMSGYDKNGHGANINSDVMQTATGIHANAGDYDYPRPNGVFSQSGNDSHRQFALTFVMPVERYIYYASWTSNLMITLFGYFVFY